MQKDFDIAERFAGGWHCRKKGDDIAEKFADDIAERLYGGMFCWGWHCGMFFRRIVWRNVLLGKMAFCRGMTLQKDLQGDGIAERFAGG